MSKQKFCIKYPIDLDSSYALNLKTKDRIRKEYEVQTITHYCIRIQCTLRGTMSDATTPWALRMRWCNSCAQLQTNNTRSVLKIRIKLYLSVSFNTSNEKQACFYRSCFVVAIIFDVATHPRSRRIRRRRANTPPVYNCARATSQTFLVWKLVNTHLIIKWVIYST